MTGHANHPFFKAVEIEELTLLNFEERMEQSKDRLTGVFFWGHHCPNCEVAKNSLTGEAVELNSFGIKWFHVNTYENFELGTRFGLHGIPTFLFFHQGKKLGRISPYPGIEPFFQALRELKAKH